MISLHRLAMLLPCPIALIFSIQTQAADTEQNTQVGMSKTYVASTDSINFADRDRLLSELHDTMFNVTNLMDKHSMMTQEQLQSVAEIVKRLSIYLRVLSQPMTSNNAASTLATIQRHNSKLNDTINELQAQLNDN